MNGYVAISHAVAEHYHAELSLSDIKVIWNSFPVQNFERDPSLNRSALLGKFGVTAEDFVVVVAARLVEQKGHRFFIRSLELLREKGLRPKALVCGEGPLEQELKKQVAEAGLQDQVVFCGAVPHDQMLQIMQGVDLAVLPSVIEGFGNVLAEAMLLECPVLATDMGAVRDIIETEISGLIVPPGDAAALSAGIERLMRDTPLRDRLGRAGRERIIECFSTDTIVEQWEEFYGNVLSSPAR
jgi:glycosyltransferase involved in cell wall biosynthesis